MWNLSRLNITLSIINFTIVVLLLAFRGCLSVTVRQGQNVQFDFPYPCNSSSVSLRHGSRAPFLTLTGTTAQLSLHSRHKHRFKVFMKDHGVDCSLHLKIKNVMIDDGGIYFSTVYKDGIMMVDFTKRFWLQVDYPPGKASCNEGRSLGDEWIELECQAKLGRLAGQIICYQDKKIMPTLTSSVEANVLSETILIMKTKPVFCCSSFLRETKEPCECKDTMYHWPEMRATEVNDSCPTTAMVTTASSFAQTTENEGDQTSPNYNISDTESHHTCPPCPNKEFNNKTAVIIHSCLAVVEVLLLLTCFIIYCKKKRHSPCADTTDRYLKR